MSKKHIPEDLEIPMITEVEPVEVPQEPELEPELEPEEYLIGKVTGCDKLRVRVEPSTEADVAKIIAKKTEVMVSIEESTDDFYKICTESGLEGFCLKKFIAIQD